MTDDKNTAKFAALRPKELADVARAELARGFHTTRTATLALELVVALADRLDELQRNGR